MRKRISIDPNICHGQACVKGTRIPVHQVLHMLANGDTVEELLAQYSGLSREDIMACLDYAASLAEEQVTPIEAAHKAGRGMKILADENIPRITVEALGKLGHDVKDIRGSANQGLSDSDLWAAAVIEQRLLISTDKGFTERRAEPHYGILVVRLRQPNAHKIHSRIMLALNTYSESQWRGLLIVMRDTTMSSSRGSDPSV